MTDAQYFGYWIGAFLLFNILVLSSYLAICNLKSRLRAKK